MTLIRLGASCAILGLLAACTSPSLIERGSYYAARACTRAAPMRGSAFS